MKTFKKALLFAVAMMFAATVNAETNLCVPAGWTGGQLPIGLSGATIATVSNLANGDVAAPIAPGELIKLSGLWFTADNGSASATSSPLPKALDGVEVLINGKPVPIAKVGIDGALPFPFYAVAQVPLELGVEVQRGRKTALVQLRLSQKAGGQCFSTGLDVPIASYAPKVWVNGGTAVAADAYGHALSENNPAAIGGWVTFYATGCGAIAGTKTGEVFPGAAEANTPMGFTVNGRQAFVGYAGAAPGMIGVCQFNAQVPDKGVWKFEVAGKEVQSFVLP